MSPINQNRKKTFRAPSLEASGKRKSIIPLRLSGFYSRVRRKIAWVLITIYLAAPWVAIDDAYLIRLDFTQDKFWVFFKVWHRTDAIFFLTVPLLLLLALFIATSLKGRIWCGYACPQTVFLDWIIRPIEEFFEGNAYKRKNALTKKIDIKSAFLKIGKHLCFLMIGSIVGNTTLMYFFGPDSVLEWMRSNPSERREEFLFMISLTGLFYFDFAWFREQFCSFICPYAKIQSVLLDDQSPVVQYHQSRAEPRGRADGHGDCIDCGLCVRVCPTGIDIRDGLQLECIQCMRCVDACDTVMESLKRAPRLIDFTSMASTTIEKEQGQKRSFNFRAAIYIGSFSALLAFTIFKVQIRPDLEFTLMRQAGASLIHYDSERLANVFQIRLNNTGSQELDIDIFSMGKGVEFICGQCKGTMLPYESKIVSLVLVFSKDFSQDHTQAKIAYGDQEDVLSLPLILGTNFKK